MNYQRKTALGLAATAGVAIALASPAAAQGYDQASLADAKKATEIAQKWSTGDVDYKAPKVTYDGPPIILRTSLHTPDVAYTSKTWRWQFDALERMSGGKIKADHRWGMTVHHVSKGFEANRDNLTDASPCWSFYKSKSFPLMQSLFLPGISPNAAVHSIVAEKMYAKYYRPEYERQGVYLGRIRATTPYIYFTKSPVTKLAELKGVKVRSGGGIQAKVQTALGATPISMTSGEFYTGFQRGIVDAMSLSDAATQVFKIDEIATNRTYVNLSRVILEMCLNKAWVDALPADLRAVVDHWGRSAAQMDTQMSFLLHGAVARDKFLKDGMKFNDLTAAEAARWQAAVTPVIDTYVKDLDAKGMPGAALVADMRKVVAAYDGKTPNQIFQDTIDNPIRGIIPAN